jgi:hypothetical protein
VAVNYYLFLFFSFLEVPYLHSVWPLWPIPRTCVFRFRSLPCILDFWFWNWLLDSHLIQVALRILLAIYLLGFWLTLLDGESRSLGTICLSRFFPKLLLASCLLWLIIHSQFQRLDLVLDSRSNTSHWCRNRLFNIFYSHWSALASTIKFLIAEKNEVNYLVMRIIKCITFVK